MAILNILHYPDERLHKVAKPVEKVDDQIRTMIDDMAETMYDAPGVGLAREAQVIAASRSADRLHRRSPRTVRGRADLPRAHRAGVQDRPEHLLRRPDPPTIAASGDAATVQSRHHVTDRQPKSRPCW